LVKAVFDIGEKERQRERERERERQKGNAMEVLARDSKNGEVQVLELVQSIHNLPINIHQNKLPSTSAED
jgi:hypothetical protein